MIVGICGLIGSGKGTVADILQNNYNFRKVSFADSLKDAVASVFCWPRYLLEGNTVESREWREQVDTWWADKLNMPGLTPRIVLQKWGTEVCRESFHNDVWIRSLEYKLRDDRNYVIPDMRIPNEIDMISRMGGQVWCVKRGPDPQWLSEYRLGGNPPEHIHASEWAWARSSFDQVFENNSSLADLYNSITACVDNNVKYI